MVTFLTQYVLENRLLNGYLSANKTETTKLNIYGALKSRLRSQFNLLHCVINKKKQQQKIKNCSNITL